MIDNLHIAPGSQKTNNDYGEKLIISDWREHFSNQ